jgi:hypothetical protein
MSGQWLDREGIITVKTYPNPSKKYHETVCVAAITREDGWVRLYPVRFRSMPEERQFKKYHRIRFRMQKSDRDPRPESYRLEEDSIELVREIGTTQQWKERREWIDPTLSAGMCEIQALQKSEGKLLGAFRPEAVTDLLIEEGTADWSEKQTSSMDQLLLFEERPTRLEKIPFVFKLEYKCNSGNCRGHSQSIIDWEIMELYRNIRRTTRNPDERKAKIRQKYLDELCSPKKDTTLFVGNHNLYPVTFMVLSVFWPPKERQKLLF